MTGLSADTSQTFSKLVCFIMHMYNSSKSADSVCMTNVDRHTRSKHSLDNGQQTAFRAISTVTAALE